MKFYPGAPNYKLTFPWNHFSHFFERGKVSHFFFDKFWHKVFCSFSHLILVFFLLSKCFWEFLKIYCLLFLLWLWLIMSHIFRTIDNFEIQIRVINEKVSRMSHLREMKLKKWIFESWVESDPGLEKWIRKFQKSQ